MIQYMTYDMMKDMILHTIGQWVVRPGRTGSPLGADWESAWGGLRTTLLLLMMILGVGSTWGQTDYSGTYYIASCGQSENRGSDYTYSPTEHANNFYLCPTKEWIYYQNSTPYYNNTIPEQSFGQPFLTTFKCRSGAIDPTTNQPYDEREAKWTLIKHPSRDCYYIRRNIDGKYLTLNQKLGNGSGDNRIRAHIEAQGSLDENHLFAVETQGTYLVISPINAKASNKTWYLNVHQGNFNSLKGEHASEKNQGPTNYADIGGIIGIYDVKSDPNAPWLFEDIILPVIEQQNDNTITITCPGCLIYYTTNGSKPDPTKVGENDPTKIYTPGTTTISMTNPVTTVKAIAVKAKDTDETLDTYSRVVSLTTQFYIGSEHPYLLQSKECQFYYMIPSVSNTLNTLNVPCKEMAWYLENAGTINDIQYYYIKNAEGGGYIYNKNDNLALNATNGETDTYMFRIAGSAEDGYSLTSKNRSKQVYKVSISTNAVSLAANATNQALWNIIAYTGRSSLPQWETTPFKPSTNDGKYYYQIKSRNPIKNGDDDVFIVLNSSDAIKCEVLPTEQKKALWVIKNVGHDTDNLLDYYTLQNAYTNELLYYTGVGQGITNNAALQMGQPSGGNETWSHFVIVQTLSTTEGVVNYNIIPRAIVDNVKSNGTPKHAYNCLNRADGGDVIGTWYDDGNSSRWTFVEQTDVPCVNPIFTETDPGTGKVITLTLPIADSATDIYFTDDGTDPTDVGITPTKYTDQSWPSSTQKFIKAFAKLKNDNTGGSISSVVTLFNNPDVTISQDTYTYNGAAQTPTISEVSITINEVKTTAASDTYEIDEYVNNTNVGSPSSENPPTVKLKDVAGDDWYIWNASKTFTIAPKAVTITASDASKTYNGSALTQAEFSATALETGDDHTFTVVMTEGSTITNVGTQPNVIATVDGVAVTTGTEMAVGNYLVTTADGTLTVNPKAVTITASNASKTYNGSALTEGGFTAYDLEAGDDHTFTVVMTEGSTITDVGTQPNVIATVDGTAVTTGTETAVGNYLVTTANGTLEVTAKAVTITAKDASKSYDGTPLTEGGFEASPLETGDMHEFAVVMTDASTITNVGTQPNVIATVDGVAVTTGTETAVGNYLVTTANGTLTISKAVLTVTARNKTITYGDAPANDGVTYDGFLNSETSSVLGGTLAYAYTYEQNGNVGNYLITPSGLTSDKYNITFVDGTLTVEQKEVTIGWSNTTLTYNGSVQFPTATVTNKINDDDVGVTVTGGESNANNVPYTATASGLDGTKAGNYKLPSTGLTQDFTINQAQLMSVTLSKTSLPYTGEEQTVTITGVTAGDGTNVTVAEVPSTEYTVDPSGSLSLTNKGSITVTVTAIGSNYTGSAEATFTITAKSIGDDTDPETGITVDIDTSTTPYTVTVKQGGTPLTVGTEYTTEKTAEDDKYIEYTVTGTGNYGGKFKTKYAKVSFDSNGSTGAPYYGTFVADADHAKPAGMTPYIITNITGNTATAVPLDYIPANVPVVLMNSADANGFKVVSGSGTASTTGNLLKEVTTAGGEDFGVAQIYVLYKGEFVLNKAGTLAKGKVYMDNPNPPNSGTSGARLKIVKGEGTGIENIEYTIESQSEAWYTLDGRRLSSKPTKKGLYLQSGKKIVVK